MKHSIPHISRELVGSTSVEWQHRPSTIADLIPDPTVLNPRDVKVSKFCIYVLPTITFAMNRC